ncbi:hypothetical protein J1N35_036415 [Gossypium stocksii]|uniref:Uncharacterized protein n=1 Tax=Gossypium stocksii TaxID=47602 RepID=A0A9D3ZJX4_9ROSI|nr:hypothetical protein J1N35_036415 [Gossypium stocksii]
MAMLLRKVEVPIVASTKSVPLSLRKRIINELNSSIEFNKIHCDSLRVEAKVVKKLVDKQKALWANLLALSDEEKVGKFADQKGGE